MAPATMNAPMVPSTRPRAFRQVQCRHQLPLTLTGAPRRGGPPEPPRPGRAGGGPGTRWPGPVVRDRLGRPPFERSRAVPVPSSAVRRARRRPSARGCRRVRLRAGASSRPRRCRGGPDSWPRGCGSPACPSRSRRSPGRSRPFRRERRCRRRRGSSPRRLRFPRPSRPAGRGTGRQSHQLCCSRVLAGGSEAAAWGVKRPLRMAGPACREPAGLTRYLLDPQFTG